MKPIAPKTGILLAFIAGTVGGSIAIHPLLTLTAAHASSPEAIEQHQREVTEQCLQTSGLRNPQPVGRIITFGDDVGYDALMVRGNYPQPHLDNQLGQMLCLFNRRTRQAYSSEADSLNRYTSDRSGFQFDYPAGFVAEVKFPSGEGDSTLEWVDLWIQDEYDRIQEIVSPTELPPNVSVAVQQNPQQLPLRDWVMQGNHFASPDRFTSLTIAGQPAIAFQSTGLYEYENVVVAVPSSSEVVLIRLDKDGLPERDARYRPTFQQVISSLQFLAE